MKIAVLAVSLWTLAGCEKAADLPKLEDEAKELAAEQKPRFEDLERRAAPLRDLGQKLPTGTPGRADAGTLLGEALGALNQIRATMSAVPVEIEAAAKSDTPGEKLTALVDRMRATFGHDDVVANADITSVDAWMAGAGNTISPAVPAPAP